jgi:hypothetical protein
MKELVKHVSSLVNVCGDKPDYSPVAKASSGGKASSGTLMDVINTDMLKKLTHPQLIELYNKLVSWDPKPELATYHISFMKQYLTLLVYSQEHRTCQVPERVNKTLFHWIWNQKTYLRLYFQNKTEKSKFHIDDHYVKFLTKLGLGKQKKFNFR